MLKDIALKSKTYLIKHQNVNWALADQAVVSGSNFILGILLARMLGIAEFGVYSLAMLVILFANMIQQSAINAPMMSIGPKQVKADMPTYYGSVFAQSIIFSSVSAILTFLGVKILSSSIESWNIESLALPLSINVFLVQMQDFIRRYFYTAEKPACSFITDFIRYIGLIVFLGIMFWGASISLNAQYVFWASSVFTLISIIFLIKNFLGLSFSLVAFKIHLKRHWNFSKWLTASAFLQWFTGNIFTITAGTMLGTSAVGALKAAQSLLGITHIVFLALENIVPIKAAKLYHNKQIEQMKQYLTKTAIIGVTCVIIVSAIFAIYPKFWFSLLFGEEFVQYSYLIRYICVFYIIVSLLLPIRFALRAIEDNKIFFYAYVLISVLSIISVVWVVGTFGVEGVAVASIITQVILVILASWYLRKRLIEGSM